MTANSAFFCDLEALTPEQRRRHVELAKKLRPLVDRFTELPDGYAVRFRTAQDIQPDVEEFMTLEKLCCPFFELTLEVNSRNQPEHVIIVNVTGPGDIKPFIRAEFAIPG